MRVLLQRVSEAWVAFEDGETPRAGPGLLALVGFRDGDGATLLEPMANKLLSLRVFEDEQGRMNRSLQETGGALVLVPQFTLYADCRKGRRPGFSEALAPAEAAALFEGFVGACRAAHDGEVSTGRFGAAMQVHLVNDGPVTILLDSEVLALARR